MAESPGQKKSDWIFFGLKKWWRWDVYQFGTSKKSGGVSAEKVEAHAVCLWKLSGKVDPNMERMDLLQETQFEIAEF